TISVQSPESGYSPSYVVARYDEATHTADLLGDSSIRRTVAAVSGTSVAVSASTYVEGPVTHLWRHEADGSTQEWQVPAHVVNVLASPDFGLLVIARGTDGGYVGYITEPEGGVTQIEVPQVAEVGDSFAEAVGDRLFRASGGALISEGSESGLTVHVPARPALLQVSAVELADGVAYWADDSDTERGSSTVWSRSL